MKCFHTREGGRREAGRQGGREGGGREGEAGREAFCTILLEVRDGPLYIDSWNIQALPQCNTHRQRFLLKVQALMGACSGEHNCLKLCGSACCGQTFSHNYFYTCTWTIPLLNMPHMRKSESADHWRYCTGSRQVWRLTIWSVVISRITSRYCEQLAMYLPSGENCTKCLVCWKASEKFMVYTTVVHSGSCVRRVHNQVYGYFQIF